MRLTEMKIPTRGDRSDRVAKSMGYGEWSPAVVSQILGNETYCGIWYYGKTGKVNGKCSHNHSVSLRLMAQSGDGSQGLIRTSTGVSA
jgi:hypothetical protein